MPADRTTTDYEALTDEELWDSPLGHRLRYYADKLLAAEQARVEQVTRNRANKAAMSAGLEGARELVSPLGDPFQREDDWAVYRSPVMEGLRKVISETDGTIPAVQQAAKAYIARLQADERPVADEFPPEEYDMPVGPPWSGDEEAPADDSKEATPLDVAGALSYLLTGRALSDSGPFAVHDADGFHDEPYVLLSVDSMRRVLDRLPESTW